MKDYANSDNKGFVSIVFFIFSSGVCVPQSDSVDLLAVSCLLYQSCYKG